MIVFNVLLTTLYILLLLLLLILLTPFGYRVKAVSLDKKSISFSALWFFGLFKFSGAYVLDQGFESSARIIGLKIKTDKIGKVKKEKTEKEKKKEKRKKEGISFSVEGIKCLLSGIKKVLFYIMPNKIEGYGRLGFQDPYYTGLVCSFVEALRGVYFNKLNLDYVFEDEVYEGEVYIEGRIFLIYFVYIAVRLLLNKSVRKLTFN